MKNSVYKAVRSALYASTAPLAALAYEIRSDIVRYRTDTAAGGKRVLLESAECLLKSNPNCPVAQYYLSAVTGVL